ncbi:MAG: hypothetical protein ABEJ71_02780, partial [Halodesulfurarchaeum sp.]
ADRARLDRWANAAMPVAVAYLLAGSGALVSVTAGWSWPAGGRAAVAHLLGAGGLALAILAVGCRLYPRFLVATPPRYLPRLVLGTGAVGPAALAMGVGGASRLLWIGAVLEATAITGFAALYALTFRRSDRRRIGLYGPLAGSALALAGALLELWMVLSPTGYRYLGAHRRLMLIGFLGTTIAGTAFQFYPPAVGTLPRGLASDRTAAVALGALSLGVALEALGIGRSAGPLVTLGGLLATAGGLLVAVLVWATLRERDT